MMNNSNNTHTSGVENQKFSPFSKIKHLISSKNPFKNTKKTSKLQNQKNNINNIDNIDTPQIEQHSYPTLIFATHNIQGSLNQKRDDLLLYMMEHDIDCLFVCETNIVDPNFSPTLKTAWQKIIAPIHNNSNNTFYFINNPDLEHRGSGSTFILTEKLHKHLQTTKILDHGRCIKITLNFKNHKIFNIYGIYLPSGKDKSNEHIKKTRLNNICKILFDDIAKTKSRDHTYTTIMGDFNINYSKEILKKGKSISYIDAMDKIKNNQLEQWMCYKILKLLNFTNIATTFKKESEKTWFSSCTSSASSTTVDYIWASNNLNDIIIDFNLTRTTYSSDHAMLMFTFEHPNNSFVNLKNFNKSRDTGKSFNNRYNLNSIQKEDWVTFNNIVNEKLIRLQDIPHYSTKTQVSAVMNIFNSIITDSLHEMKVTKIKVTPRRNNLPLALRKKYNHIHQLNSIQATVKEALYIESDQFKLEIPSSAEQRKGLKNNFDRHWRRKSNWLIKLFHQYNVQNGIALYSQTLNSVEELESVHINIVNLIDHVNNEIVKERNAWDVQQIEYFINRQNEDLKTNQKRALNSILERNPRKIILDRLKFYENGDLQYTTDHQIINEKVNSHFQNIGSSDTLPNVYNPLIEMPHPWRSVYSPKTINDPDAIKKLIDPITVDELQLMIKTLPNHKAPGPSGISYELIKKLPSSFLKELVDFYNHILSTDKEYMGIEFETSLPRNIHRFDIDDRHIEKFSAKVLGYLDDTTWLTSDLNCLQKNLEIADSFYQLANNKINKDKTVILSNDKKERSDIINISFGNDSINVKLQPMGKASYCAKLSRLRSLFKNSLQLPRNTYNSVIHSRIYPHIVNIFDNQLKAQSALFFAQANCPYTSDIIKFLLLLTQQKYNLPFNPFDFFTLFDSPLRRFTRLESLFVFFKFYNISVTSHFNFKVRGGVYPISHYVIDQSFLYSHLMSLRTKGIMFLDQIITEESAYLKDYKDIKKSLQCKKGRIPRWYTFLKDNLTINSNNRLNIELDQPIMKSHNVERLKPPNISRDAFHHKGPSKWVITWSPNIIDVVYGKAITSTNFEHSVPLLYAEHWIKVPLNASTSTPRSRPNIIQPCPGCQLHFPYYIGDNRISCILKIPYSKIIRAYILQKSNIDLYSSWLPTHLLKIAKVLKHNHEYYKVVAYNDYLIRGGLITADSIQADSLDNAIPRNLNFQLLTVLIKDRLIQANLWSLAQQVRHYPLFELYTDGSFINTPGINEFHMGYGWHISNIQNQDFSYCGSIEHFPSATKAEIMAILTALIILPGGSDVTIFTDSQAAISNFQKSAHLQYVSPR
ncbi:unnamed protein product [Rhizophagus irregularis]|nr:unnamed protein product [Rhizophagus irregularis]